MDNLDQANKLEYELVVDIVQTLPWLISEGPV